MDPPPSSSAVSTSAASPPPPPPQSQPDESSAAANTSTPSMGPPPTLPPPQPPIINSDNLPPPSDNDNNKKKSNVEVPYEIPQWSEPPSLPFFLEILKDGSIIDHLDVTKKGAYMFGRIDLCDFMLEHPTISRFHAVLQFKGSGDAFLYDLGSTHGTFINKNQVKKKVYVKLHVGDVIRFGHSSRLYIFQGPEDLMLPEADLTSSSYVKDREASLRRAREDAALADGVSWGMGEDAIEEDEDDSDEITWQTFKGELTEKQQKTKEKVMKRMEKIAHMRKEIAAIRAKDISQGGLTQGQQTQIARNEMRMSQIFEELESLEETLNDSIRESIGARGRKSSRGKQKGVIEDEDELLSDDDEFYDRTKKKPAGKLADTQSIETADSLLDKKVALMEEMEEKKKVLSEEKNKISEPAAEQDAGDALDAFMSGLSSQLVVDRTVQLEKDISSLQAELDRIVYLLKIADPTGETAKKRADMVKEQKSAGQGAKNRTTIVKKQMSEDSASRNSALKRPEKSLTEKKKVSQPEKPVGSSGTEDKDQATIIAATEAPNLDGDVTKPLDNQQPTYIVSKPQWLGAVDDREQKESQIENRVDTSEVDEFVDYKDRKKILELDNSQSGSTLESELENAAPGLILRKKKPVETTESRDNSSSETSTSKPVGADLMAEDAVALLLKHKRGLYAADEEENLDSHGVRDQRESGHDNKRPKRVLGPEKPAFLENKSDLETWVPPKGQSGDGRTSLNDRLGY